MTLLQETHSLKKTPLYDKHVALHGKIIEFGGWQMPVYYTSILEEHLWVRKSCGIFDVSHLGEFHVKGKEAFNFLQYCVTNDLNKLRPGKILYSLLCNEQGMTLDDILIYQEAENDYYLIVNAGSIDRDFEFLSKHAKGGVELKNHSHDMACIAVQGPKAEAVLEKIFGFRLEELGYYAFKEEKYYGKSLWVSRSGYTGEDGFEIFCPNDMSVLLWNKLMEESNEEGIKPAGLGARNTLRLEAGNALYGHELNLSTTPLDAGLGWAVALDKKGGFVGRDAIYRQKQEGLSRKLIGFKMLDKPIARENYPVLSGGKKIGFVTSGSFAPSVGANIGMAYVESGFGQPGSIVEIEIHGRSVRAEVVKMPFISLNHKKGLKR